MCLFQLSGLSCSTTKALYVEFIGPCVIQILWAVLWIHCWAFSRKTFWKLSKSLQGAMERPLNVNSVNLLQRGQSASGKQGCCKPSPVARHDRNACRSTKCLQLALSLKKKESALALMSLGVMIKNTHAAY